MYSIIKKALDEALSEQYAAQLMSVPDESYAFSPVFEKKMGALVRKTDRPYIKYVKYLGAAACAVIAIGCSLLIPKLTESSVPVDTTQGSIVSDALPESKPPVTTAQTTSKESGASSSADTSVPAESAPELITTNPPSLGADTTDQISDTKPAEGDADLDGDSEEALDEITDTDEDSGDEDYVDFDDNDIDGEESATVEDEVVEEEDVVEEVVEDAPPLPAIPRENTLGAQVSELIGCELSESYPHKAELTQNGKSYNFSSGLSIPETAELFFDKELAERLESAELTEQKPEISDRYITVEIADVSLSEAGGLIFTGSAYDFSPRNSYGALFFGETDEDSEDVAEDYIIEAVDFKACTVIFYDNSVIAVSSGEYGGTVYFLTESEISDELFSRAESSLIPENVTNPTELLGFIASSEDDIQNAYLSTQRTLYDIRMGAPCGGGYLYELLKNKAYGTVVQAQAQQRSDGLLSFSFISAKNAQSYSLILYSDSKAELRTGHGAEYLFDLPAECAADTLDYLCELNGTPAAVRYENLEEYLKGKNFSEISYAVTSGYSDVSYAVSENSEQALSEIYRIISDSAKSAAYIPSGTAFVPYNEETIFINVPVWTAHIKICDNILYIFTYSEIDAFSLPEGASSEIYNIMKKYGEAFEEEDIVMEE